MTYEDFLARIEHADIFGRLDALEALQMEADERTTARAAGRLLSDEDPGVREQAARLLIETATQEAAAQTVPYIASDDITVRNLAGEVLIQ
ncbi:MAG: HEAT repeat domain-containing protein, partial [Rhodothermales bacterium]